MESVKHTVKSGECLSGIAKAYGFSDYRKIYDHPGNKEFKKKRPNPDLIYPGDVIIIPAKELNTLKKASGSNVKIKVSRPKKTVRVKVTSLGKPYKNAKASIFIDGTPFDVKDFELKDLTTNNEGILEAKIPYEYIHHESTIVDLIVDGDHFQLQLGALDPMCTITGIQQRLVNLGYKIRTPEGIISKSMEKVITQFKLINGLAENSKIDDEFRKKLALIHDGNDEITDMEPDDQEQINTRNKLHESQSSRKDDDEEGIGKDDDTHTNDKIDYVDNFNNFLSGVYGRL